MYFTELISRANNNQHQNNVVTIKTINTNNAVVVQYQEEVITTEITITETKMVAGIEVGTSTTDATTETVEEKETQNSLQKH